MKESTALLSRIPLFEGIAPSDLEGLLDCLGGRVREFHRGQTILAEGEPRPPLGVILSGTADVVREDASGNRTILQRLGPFMLFGETFACAQLDENPAAVQALSDGRALLMDFAGVSRRCAKACAFHSRLIENMMRILARKNMLLARKVDILSKPTIRGRIAAYLMETLRSGRDSVRIPYNRGELADYLCVNRSALSREMGRMRDDGILSFQKNAFRILDMRRLSGIVSGMAL